jgi:HSP20 family protein
MAGTLTRWDPFADFGLMRQRIDRMFEDLTAGGEQSATRAKIDVVEKDGDLLVRADMPGIKPEDIEVEVHGDVLTIRGQHEESTEESKETYLRRERSYKSFSRSLSLPPGVDAKAIEASCHDGVLEVTVPMPKEESSQPITIKPRSSNGAETRVESQQGEAQPQGGSQQQAA